MKNCAGKLVLILVLVLLVLAVSGARTQSAVVSRLRHPAPNDAVIRPHRQNNHSRPRQQPTPAAAMPGYGKAADGSLSEEPTDSQVDESRPTGQVTFLSAATSATELIQHSSLADRESVMDLCPCLLKPNGMAALSRIEGLKSIQKV